MCCHPEQPCRTRSLNKEVERARYQGRRGSECPKLGDDTIPRNRTASMCACPATPIVLFCQTLRCPAGEQNVVHTPPRFRPTSSKPTPEILTQIASLFLFLFLFLRKFPRKLHTT